MMALKKAQLHCAACGAEAPRKKFRSVGIERVPQPDGFANAYARLGLSYADCAGYAGRRAIHGMLVGAIGLDTATGGGGVSLHFERNVLVACIGTMANAGCIPIADLTEVSVGSRADFVGRDTAEIDRSSVSGVLSASAITALRYREPSPTETIVTVTWDDGGIVVLNQTVPSEQAIAAFQPVVERAFKARSNSGSSIVDQIALLAMFQESGMMTQAEVESAAAKALHKSDGSA